MLHQDQSCNNYSDPESWLCASRRLSGVPKNAGTVPDTSGCGFSVFLCHGQKPYSGLCRPVPETDRFSEDPVSLYKVIINYVH